MVVIEKKTGTAGTNQPHDFENNDPSGQKPAGNTSKQTNPTYQSAPGSNSGYTGSGIQPDKSDNNFDEGIPGGKVEDDLPF